MKKTYEKPTVEARAKLEKVSSQELIRRGPIVVSGVKLSGKEL